MQIQAMLTRFEPNELGRHRKKYRSSNPTHTGQSRLRDEAQSQPR